MTAEIDQSGKIEQSEFHTIVAIANGIKKTIILKRKDKRTLQNIFRQTNKRHNYRYLIFSALIAILIKECEVKEKVLIDEEYLGHEKLIKSQIIIYLQKLGKRVMPDLRFGLVTKRSSAHQLGAKTSRKIIKPNISVGWKEIINLIQ